jgi:hypothetical protein
LLRIRAAQFLHAKFGEIFENKSTNKLHEHHVNTFIFNDLSIPIFTLGVFGFFENLCWSIQAKHTVATFWFRQKNILDT